MNRRQFSLAAFFAQLFSFVGFSWEDPKSDIQEAVDLIWSVKASGQPSLVYVYLTDADDPVQMKAAYKLSSTLPNSCVVDTTGWGWKQCQTFAHEIRQEAVSSGCAVIIQGTSQPNRSFMSYADTSYRIRNESSALVVKSRYDTKALEGVQVKF